MFLRPMNLNCSRSALLALVPFLLAGCGGTGLWPLGGATERSLKPANAAEYRCVGGKAFYVRNIDAGAVWLLAPDREIRLEKLSGAESGRYGAGRVVLEISGEDATLFDPPAQFAGCKRAG